MAEPESRANGSPKQRAELLAFELVELAIARPTVTGDGGLSEAVVEQLQAKFGNEPSRGGVAAEDGRGTNEYWSDHGLVTADLMRILAQDCGGFADLYDRVGRVHDLDYLAFPHDGPGQGDRHPVPLVRTMLRCGVHPAICLAVLEHAPYVGRSEVPSSRLSAALSAAEDLATLAALDPPSPDVDRLSPAAGRLFLFARPQRMIGRRQKVRVEIDVERYINMPLAHLAAGRFEFDV